ncbi:helix-hairpin-helix domain-containing protein [bacterium]|nr:MAG: helix-hairpin-helix domain-containing protein [bacterium]
MFELTRQERQVIIFLSLVALVGLGINFLEKVSPPIRALIRCDNHFYQIDLNQATETDLLSVQLISLQLARRIIAYRASHGQFSNLEQLKEIKGIGEARYEKIKDLFFIK